MQRSQKPSTSTLIPKHFVGQPILAAAGFQPAPLFVSRGVGFCRKRRSRQGSSVAHVNAICFTASFRKLFDSARGFSGGNLAPEPKRVHTSDRCTQECGPTIRLRVSLLHERTTSVDAAAQPEFTDPSGRSWGYLCTRRQPAMRRQYHH